MKEPNPVMQLGEQAFGQPNNIISEFGIMRVVHQMVEILLPFVLGSHLCLNQGLGEDSGQYCRIKTFVCKIIIYYYIMTRYCNLMHQENYEIMTTSSIYDRKWFGRGSKIWEDPEDRHVLKRKAIECATLKQILQNRDQHQQLLDKTIICNQQDNEKLVTHQRCSIVVWNLKFWYATKRQV